MASSLVEFSKSLDAWRAKAQRKLVKLPQRAFRHLVEDLVAYSPVLTGKYMGNHVVSLDEPTDEYDPERKDLTGDQTLEYADEVLAQITLETRKVYVQNNAPHARRLEYGWSQQAPAGVYRAAKLANAGIGGRLDLSDA